MCPVLFKLGPIAFHSYGLFMALAVIFGISIMEKESLRLGWNPKKMTRFVVYDFLAALIGSRVAYIFTRLNEPNLDYMDLLFNPNAGFVYYGGFIAAWAWGVWYVLKRLRLPLFAVTDVCCLVIAFGMFIGRIGCFLGGCCYGRPTDLPWGTVMKTVEHLGRVHPVQMYESLIMLGVFLFLWSYRKKKRFNGEISALYIGIYAVVRYFTELYRGDQIRGFVVEKYLSTSQFISIPMLLVAFALYFSLRKKRKA